MSSKRRGRRGRQSQPQARREVTDYRYDEKRKNNPEDGLLSYEKSQRETKTYQYDPHLDPQLQWAGKGEHTSFPVDTVSLHIHERISAAAILESVQRRPQWVQTTLNLFAEPELPLDKRIEFYEHDVDWSNRLILGDSLLVMNSLIERELMAGNVQMIYIDPPYGIGYDSNFQPNIKNRDVKDGRDDSLTREPEQIKAYRDTWTLGIHSYLTYLRDRLLLSNSLLNDTGSIFVQINDLNLHHVRELMDEIFGPENFCGVIVFQTAGGQPSKTLASVADYILWYSKEKARVRYHQLFHERPREMVDSTFNWVELTNGTCRIISGSELEGVTPMPIGRRFKAADITRRGADDEFLRPLRMGGKTYRPPSGFQWAYSPEEMERLVRENRLVAIGERLYFKRYAEDFPVTTFHNVWTDTVTSTFASDKIFVVQTNTKVVERCILMVTDPGDLVFDPTCGSGTTAYCAEKFGRRWITCDTSRVALALARQRLLCAVFEYYDLARSDEGVKSGFVYEDVPHITLTSIAEDEPPKREILYNRPRVNPNKVRVSGPFTVEAIPVPAVEEPFSPSKSKIESARSRPNEIAGDHILDMFQLLQKAQDVSFPRGKHLGLENLRVLAGRGFLHAEAESTNGDRTRVAISFGPRYGPVTVHQLEEAMSEAQWDYKLLLLAGFSFDPEVQAFIQKNPHPRLSVQQVNINPDVFVSDLLKTPKGSQIFSVFGQPDIALRRSGGDWHVELRGVDIYDPITGKTDQSKGDKVAAWFLDSNYDGYTFRMSQAFFPDGATAKSPWDKLENALRGVVDTDKMEQFRSTVSLPFKSTEHGRIAVKVIDYRGNEAVAIRTFEDGS